GAGGPAAGGRMAGRGRGWPAVRAASAACGAGAGLATHVSNAEAATPETTEATTTTTATTATVIRLHGRACYFPAILSRVPSNGFIEPCLPSPADKPPSSPEWVHEIKHDGYRLMARRDPVAIGVRLKTSPEAARVLLRRRYSLHHGMLPIPIAGRSIELGLSRKRASHHEHDPSRVCICGVTAGDRAARGSAGADLAGPAHPVHHLAGGGRRHRHHLPHHRRAVVARGRPAGRSREPARRRKRYRHTGGSALGAQRLHVLLCERGGAGDRPLHLQVAAVRSDKGFHRRLQGGRGHLPGDGASEREGDHAAGTVRARQG